MTLIGLGKIFTKQRTQRARSKPFATILAVLWMAATPMLAQAELTVQITRGNDQAVAVAVVPFAWKGNSMLPEDVAEIIGNDLRLSGQFAPVSSNNFLAFPEQADQVFFDDWRRIGSSYLLIGNINNKGTNNYSINYQLFDVLAQKSIMQGEVSGTTSQLRAIAHRISDEVYDKITGVPGIFSTRIIYVVANRDKDNSMSYELVYADMDGHRAVPILKSKEPLLAPSWSPDGTQVAYVSFESGRPAIYIQNIASGQREKLTDFQGLNSAPTWSPDGKKLAMVLSKDGNPDIYVMDLTTRKLERVVNHYALDNEPAWMPDGKSLIFTSNRSGSAQLYQLELASGNVKRLSFEGKFNARAKVFPDGKSIAFIHKGQGDSSYNVAVQDLTNNRMRILSTSKFEDAPDIAPNGRMLIYSSQGDDRGVLGITSADGQVSFRLPSSIGDVREPAWSPMLN